MRHQGQHILFIATEYAAGMRPYANAIIHSLWQEGDHVLAVAKDDQVKHDLDDLPPDAVSWIDYPVSKVKKMAFRFKPTQLLREIHRRVSTHQCQLIYSLTGELILSHHIEKIHNMVPVLYTIHDATGHDSKFDGIITWLKHKILIQMPQQRLIRHTPLQVTNSKEQQQLLERRFPHHKVMYAPFPTLVTDNIAHGQSRVPELENTRDGYILFFGNLQLYKGVHLLYNTYISHPELQHRPLVIAGAGYIYFKRREHEPGEVIFINRFIDDQELKHLFSHAAVVVYPYISATQSGVTSIASYFGKPMVLSDLPFFKQTCEGIPGIGFFSCGNQQSLARAIECQLQSPATTQELYQREYSPDAMRAALDDIISSIDQNLGY